jgi:hypothetical protein
MTGCASQGVQEQGPLPFQIQARLTQNPLQRLQSLAQQLRRSMQALLPRREIRHRVMVPSPASLPHPFRPHSIGGAHPFGG